MQPSNPNHSSPAIRRPVPLAPVLRHRGVVLIITLILVVILSLLGTFAIRNATQSERSIKGVQASVTAREAAETALRFCEQIAVFDFDNKDYVEYGTTGLRQKVIATTITSEDDATAAWRTAANWVGTNAISVPDQYYKRYANSSAATDSLQLTNPPRCIIQRIQTTSTPTFIGYLITGRGFANNATFNTTTGKTTYGAEAWVQSILSNS